LCGPTALFSLGLGHEILASSFRITADSKFTKHALLCGIAALPAFTLFGLMNTYILHSWDATRLIQYVFINGIMTAIAVYCLVLAGLNLAKSLNSGSRLKVRPLVVQSTLGILLVLLWIMGSVMKF
jgi:hypothetical protein